MLARHSSQVVFEYIRDAPLAAAPTIAGRVSAGLAYTASCRVAAAAAGGGDTTFPAATAGAPRASRPGGCACARGGPTCDSVGADLPSAPALLEACARIWEQSGGASRDPAKAFERIDASLTAIQSRVDTLERAPVVEAAAPPLISALDLQVLRERITAIEQLLIDSPAATPAPIFVTNATTGVVHVILHGKLTDSPRSWRSLCGWAFGLANARRCSELPAVPKLICEKCLPNLKRNLKTKHGEIAEAVAAGGAPAALPGAGSASVPSLEAPAAV